MDNGDDDVIDGNYSTNTLFSLSYGKRPMPLLLLLWMMPLNFNSRRSTHVTDTNFFSSLFFMRLTQCVSFIAFLHDLTLFWSFFLIHLSFFSLPISFDIYYECYDSHSVALCSHCICLFTLVCIFRVALCVLPFLLLLLLLFSSPLHFLFFFWFLHHLLFLCVCFSFNLLCVARCVFWWFSVFLV